MDLSPIVTKSYASECTGIPPAGRRRLSTGKDRRAWVRGTHRGGGGSDGPGAGDGGGGRMSPHPASVANFVLDSVTVTGKRLGPGTALVDEDVLRVLLLDALTGEKTLQMRYDAIVGVAMSNGLVVITSRDGRELTASTKDAPTFRLRVLAACRALPEVTRALRALGSRR